MKISARDVQVSVFSLIGMR